MPKKKKRKKGVIRARAIIFAPYYSNESIKAQKEAWKARSRALVKKRLPRDSGIYNK